MNRTERKKKENMFYNRVCYRKQRSIPFLDGAFCLFIHFLSLYKPDSYSVSFSFFSVFLTLGLVFVQPQKKEKIYSYVYVHCLIVSPSFRVTGCELATFSSSLDTKCACLLCVRLHSYVLCNAIPFFIQ